MAQLAIAASIASSYSKMRVRAGLLIDRKPRDSQPLAIGQAFEYEYEKTHPNKPLPDLP